jgi:spermidine synthase
MLCVPGLVCVFMAGWIRQRWLAGLLAVGLAGLLMVDVDGFSTALQFPGQRVVFRGQSPYGKLVVTEAAGQLNYIENGGPLFSTHNTEQIEETVHYAMAQRPAARRVLLIGGGVTGTAREILKYPDATVTYVELDPLILKVVPVQGPRIRVVNTDGRRFIQQTSERFDVVIVDLPGPKTSQLNRFFTAEFFAEVQQHLAPDGVLSFALGRYENYVSPELTQLLASAYQTVKTRFDNVLLIPGGRIHFLASNGKLSLAIAGRLEEAGIATRFVNRHYLDATLTPDRINDLQRAVAQPAKINRDFKPVLYLYQLRHWLSEFGGRFGWPEVVLGLALVVYVVRLRATALVIFAGGFAASALEVVLLLAFQILYGSLYRQLGVIVTMFMAGLAVGAWWANRRPLRLPWLALGIAVLAAVLPGLIRVGWLIAPLTFGLAMLVGMEFPVASRAEPVATAATASRLFTADFVGACLGALLVSTWLIPWLGVGPACWLAAGLNLVAAGVAWRKTP